MKKQVKQSALGAAVLGLSLATAAQANITIVPTFDSSITNDPNAAAIEAPIYQAIAYYQANITTPTTVNITFTSMSSGLGQSSTFYGSVSYSQYRTALIAHSSGNAIDTAALATLPNQATNPVNGNATVDASTPLLRALGFNASVPSDSTIGLNTSIMNFSRTGINPAKYDELSTVEHEMDEVLGLGSNLDSGSTTGAVLPEDLFRYSAAGVRSFTTSTSATSYFSYDGGVTNVAGFNQAGPPGGSDYGDWDSSIDRVQNAFGDPGAIVDIGTSEISALDAIGYTFATPEPASLGLLAVAGMGLLRRRTRA